ncbi:MAG: UpxY family transcription antiterminator [Bacteroidetes bacterium]|nr:MAG: UpxY family transcription antiterminator [Bacteroidota bacterium]
MELKNKYGLTLNDPRWFAVYVKYKREKLVRDRLQENDIEVYLPLKKYVRQYTRKIREVEIPLISCYIFTKITRKQYLTVLKTPDVVNFVRLSNQLISIPENEILLIKRIMGEGIDIEAEPNRYLVGDKVEIIGGNLTGLQGILMATDQNKNFLIELTQTGYSLRMQIDQKLLRKLYTNTRPVNPI